MALSLFTRTRVKAIFLILFVLVSVEGLAAKKQKRRSKKTRSHTRSLQHNATSVNSVVAVKDQSALKLTERRSPHTDPPPTYRDPMKDFTIDLPPLLRSPYHFLLSSIDYQHSDLLSKVAHNIGSHRNRKGLCMRWVRIALEKANREARALFASKPTESHAYNPYNLNNLPKDPDTIRREASVRSPGASAEAFREWAAQNPVSMCQQLGLANVSGLPETESQKGFLHVYQKGRCGFHPRYGHIEVFTDAEKGEACSDHCRKVDKSCAPDLILAPVASCNWLVLDDHHRKDATVASNLSVRKAKNLN
jgi:hypothetical protein